MEDNIKHLRYKIPDTVSKDAQSLIKGMIKKKPQDRMSLDQIMAHKWFKKFKLSFNQRDIETEIESRMMDSILVNNNDPFVEFMNSGRNDDELDMQIAEEKKEIEKKK